MKIMEPADIRARERAQAAATHVYLHLGPTALALPLLQRRFPQRPLALHEALDGIMASPSGDETSERVKRQVALALLRHAHGPGPSALKEACKQGWQRVATHIREPIEKAIKESVEQDLHQVALQATTQCETRKHTAVVEFDPDTFITSARASIEVNRPVAAFCKQADPQNWSNSAPTVFKTTYRVATDNEGRPMRDRDGIPEPVENPVIGESWQGLLYEDVAFRWDSVPLAEFKNVLSVNYEVSSAEIHLDFYLYEAISVELGTRKLPGGLEVDHGSFHAEALDGGWTRITAEKDVRFRDLTPDDSPYLEPADSGQFLNYMAPALVGLFMDDLIYNGACKTTPG